MARNQNLYNDVAERTLIGRLLASATDYWSIQETVRADHFADRGLRDIFTAISDICQSGKMLSLTAIEARLPAEDESGMPTISRLLALMESAREAGAALDYAPTVAEAAARRRLIAISETLAKEAGDSTKMAIDIAGAAEASITEIMQSVSPLRPRKIGAIVKKVVSQSAAANQSNVLPGVTTGFTTLDELLGLIMPRDLGYIMGSQGDGKSALAMQIAMHVAQTHQVLFFALDTAGERLATREVANEAKLSIREIQEGSFDLMHFDDIMAAEQRLQHPNLWIHDDKRMLVRQMRSIALAMKRTRGLGLMVVDHLHKILWGARMNKFDGLADSSNQLKDLANELDIPIICLVQRTRRSQRGDDPTPQIDDAETNSVEYDGDWVLAVFRKINWLIRNKPSVKAPQADMDQWVRDVDASRGKASMILLKHRGKEAHEERQCDWIGKYTRFAELSR